jgi:hypothetical protein
MKMGFILGMQQDEVIMIGPITICFIGAPGRNRTCGTWIRNPLLYPLSYGGENLTLITLILAL